MSFMKGDLLTRTRKLVKGLAKSEPIWLKAMEQAPPPTFPRPNGKLQKINLPEDPYINKFCSKHPESRYEEAIKFSGSDPHPARVFGSRVLELKAQGVPEKEAIALADMEYCKERTEKKKAYTRLKEIAHILGKKPPRNPYPVALKARQAEEKKYVHDRFFNPSSRSILKRLIEDKETEMQERKRGGR